MKHFQFFLENSSFMLGGIQNSNMIFEKVWTNTKVLSIQTSRHKFWCVEEPSSKTYENKWSHFWRISVIYLKQEKKVWKGSQEWG